MSPRGTAFFSTASSSASANSLRRRERADRVLLLVGRQVGVDREDALRRVGDAGKRPARGSRPAASPCRRVDRRAPARGRARASRRALPAPRRARSRRRPCRARLAKIGERLWVAEDERQHDRVCRGCGVAALARASRTRRASRRASSAIFRPRMPSRAAVREDRERPSRPPSPSRRPERLRSPASPFASRIVHDPPRDELPRRAALRLERESQCPGRIGRHERLDAVPVHERQVRVRRVLPRGAQFLGDGPSLSSGRNRCSAEARPAARPAKDRLSPGPRASPRT